MEPLGATASILTLLAAAGQSCKFLHTLCIDLSEAPKDIRNQAVKLQSFDLAVQHLLKAYEKLPSEFEVDAGLRKEIARFENEVTSMRVKIERKLDALRQGRKQKLRESCRWLLFDRQMTKFLQSADHWSLIMSHAAMTAQMSERSILPQELLAKSVSSALSSRIDQNVVALLSLTQRLEPWTIDSTKETANTSLVPRPHTLPISKRLYRREKDIVPERFAKYIYTYMEPVGFAPRHWTVISIGALTLNCNSGALLLRRFSPKGRETYQILRASGGYGLNVIAQSSSLLRGRVTFLMLATYIAENSLKLNLRCSLQWGRLFAFDGPHHMAIKRGDIDYLMLHFSSRTLGIADVTSNGDTLLHLAAGHDQSNLIDLLANEGADVNATNNGGETPLHVCLRVGKSYECARKLLNHGADILRENKDGRTPLHTFFHDAVGQVIRYHNDELDSLCQDRRGMTVAHWASWTSQSLPEDITYQSAMSKKSYSPYLVLDVHGKSMLHFAVERGNVNLVQYLLRQPESSRMTAPDDEGRTLLHYATASSRFHLIYPLLVTRQPNIYQRDKHGRTFLHYAAMRGNVSAVEHVLNLGLVNEHELGMKDIDGRTPIQLSQLRGRTSVVDLLQLHFPSTTITPNQTLFNCEKALFNEKLCERNTVKIEKQRGLLEFNLIIVLIVLIVCWKLLWT